jgi:hypothetical protein
MEELNRRQSTDIPPGYVEENGRIIPWWYSRVSELPLLHASLRWDGTGLDGIVILAFLVYRLTVYLRAFRRVSL